MPARPTQVLSTIKVAAGQSYNIASLTNVDKTIEVDGTLTGAGDLDVQGNTALANGTAATSILISGGSLSLDRLFMATDFNPGHLCAVDRRRDDAVRERIHQPIRGVRLAGRSAQVTNDTMMIATDIDAVGNLTNNGTLTASGTLDITGGRLTNNGTIIGGTLNAAGALTNFAGGTLTGGTYGGYLSTALGIGGFITDNEATLVVESGDALTFLRSGDRCLHVDQSDLATRRCRERPEHRRLMRPMISPSTANSS